MRDIVLYFGGGVMAGVFGAGVAAKLQEFGAYDRLEAVYAGSAGVPNAMYFLSCQTELAATIYYDNLTHDFIFPWRLPRAIVERLKCGGNLSCNRTNVVDIDYLMDVMERIKQLDFEKVVENKVPLYAKLLNLESGRVEYVKPTKSNIFNVLRASITLMPYFYSPTTINGMPYADAVTKDSIGIDYLLEKHPNSKIVLILCYRLNVSRIPYIVKNFLEGKVASRMYGVLGPAFSNKEKRWQRDLIKAQKDERVIIVSPPDSAPARADTTDHERLIKMFELGKREGNKLRYIFQHAQIL